MKALTVCWIFHWNSGLHPRQKHEKKYFDRPDAQDGSKKTCMAWCSSSSSSSSSCLCPALPLRSRMLPAVTAEAAEAAEAAAAALLRVMRPSELRRCCAFFGISIYGNAAPVRFVWKVSLLIFLFGQNVKFMMNFFEFATALMFSYADSTFATILLVTSI